VNWLLDGKGHVYEADARDTIALCGAEATTPLDPESTVMLPFDRLPAVGTCKDCLEEAAEEEALQ
jgi:hypothetical protein